MPRALILGGYGLIGAACLRALRRAGFQVTGLGRSAAAARMADAQADWIIRDITSIRVDEWRGLLDGVDVVVNASGALQDGARDNLTAIHHHAVARLAEAAAGLPLRIVQISAAGVTADAPTAFFRSKAAGDAAITAAAADWVILRPVLVLAPEAYGGTALLRAAAALPGTLPVLLPEAQVQTVHIDDLTAAVVASAQGRIASGTIADLTEAQAQPFPVLLAEIRGWLGLPPARWRPRLPGWGLTVVAGGADLLGHLGWRSPLRSTAIAALRHGVTGDPQPWAQSGGAPCRALAQTLTDIPATAQERLFARAWLALPLAIAVLALFWTVSGLVALKTPGWAVQILTARGMAEGPAWALVLGGALADLALGLAVLWRPLTRAAAGGMVLLSVGYMAGAAIVTPDLWADPLGAMVKVLPGTALAALVWALMARR